MAKFNQLTKGRNKTTNFAGGNAYKQTSEMELASILLTSFVQKEDYYRSGSDTVKKLTALLDSVNPEFAAKAAIYARNEFGMRSITHVLSAELAKYVSGQAWAKKFYSAVIRRPDDMIETLAYYMSKGNKSKMTKAMQRGFAHAFGKFDAYQLAKYKNEKKEVSLIDLVNLVHPVPTARNGIVKVAKSEYISILELKIQGLSKKPVRNAEKILEIKSKITSLKRDEKKEISIDALEALTIGLLKNTKTWESKLSEAGQKAESTAEKNTLKAEAWKDLILKREIGYFALLRNLRNILEQAPELTEQACRLLTDEKLIRKSLVLPFRYLTAIKEIEKITGRDAKKVLISLSEAIDISCQNVPKFDGETLVVADLSGSMSGPIAGQDGRSGGTSRIEVASLFSAVMAKANFADFITFGTGAKYMPVNPADSTLTIATAIATSNDGSGWYSNEGSGKYHVGHGTNFSAIFESANKKYDRIFIFSDMQAWKNGGAPNTSNYKKKYGANPNIYSIDLAGLGTMAFPENNVYALAGFSEKIFDLMGILEQDRKALVNTIHNYIEF